ncbi:hypothetical protein HYE36_06675 [Mycoplasmopsis bovis]|nr:hypothetical protein [Mycoplasmopsis bovis]WHL49760.1 hypothetical protein HYE36_06675 [Mycoplasmopsis bovis]
MIQKPFHIYMEITEENLRCEPLLLTTLEPILKDYEIYAGGTIFSKETTKLKVKVNEQEMHFSLVKLIPDKYIKSKLATKIPNSSWTLASLTFKPYEHIFKA